MRTLGLVLVGMVAMLAGCAADAADVDGDDVVIGSDDAELTLARPTFDPAVTYALASSGEVRIYDMDDNGGARQKMAFAPYGVEYRGGVSVAMADVNGDGVPDVITGSATGAAHVKVFDGRTGAAFKSFFAFDPSFTGGVRVAVGDVTGDGTADIIVGAGAGVGHVKVFDGNTMQVVRSFFAYDPSMKAGVRIAVGDVNGDGRADIVTAPGAGAAPHVKVFSGQDGSLLAGFLAYNTALKSGLEIATGDFDGDGRADIATVPSSDGSAAVPAHVKAFSAMNGATLASFFAVPTTISASGATVASMPDLDNDGREEIVLTTPSLRRVFPSATPGQYETLPGPVVRVGASSSQFVSAIVAQ